MGYRELEALNEVDRAELQRRVLKVVAARALALTDLGLRALTKHVIGEALTVKDVAEHLNMVEKEVDALEGALAGWTDKVSTLEASFAALIERYALDYSKIRHIPLERIRFVILIDDLDRCLPDRAVAVLAG